MEATQATQAETRTKLMDIREIMRLHTIVEQQKKLYWYLTDDYKHEEKFTIFNEISNRKIILEKCWIDYDEISDLLRTINNASNFQRSIHTIRDSYYNGSDAVDYDINTVICKKGDEYFIEYEFDGVDCGVDGHANKLLPVFPIDKTELVDILTEIIQYKADWDAEQERQKELELKAQFTEQYNLITSLARKHEELKSRMSNNTHVSKEVLHEIEQQLNKCLKKLS